MQLLLDWLVWIGEHQVFGDPIQAAGQTVEAHQLQGFTEHRQSDQIGFQNLAGILTRQARLPVLKLHAQG